MDDFDPIKERQQQGPTGRQWQVGMSGESPWKDMPPSVRSGGPRQGTGLFNNSPNQPPIEAKIGD